MLVIRMIYAKLISWLEPYKNTLLFFGLILLDLTLFEITPNPMHMILLLSVLLIRIAAKWSNKFSASYFAT